MENYRFIKKQDEEVFKTLEGEEGREAKGLELIPSENYVSKAVREANGSVFTNKYSEGYPGKRYYGGQDFTDIVETIAIERAKKLFNCNFANVQPLSGAPANVAMYFALMEPGDTVLGMDLSHGGHLTHGHPTTWINKIFKFVRYKMKDVNTGEIDYDELREVALREKPKIIPQNSSRSRKRWAPIPLRIWRTLRGSLRGVSHAIHLMTGSMSLRRRRTKHSAGRVAA
jgi:glycine hydroxymethyltransferase